MIRFQKARAWLRHAFDGLFCVRDAGTARLGTDSSWFVRADLLPPGARVISGGVGKDVSFEVQLAKQWGCEIHLFDPSPTGVATMSRAENNVPGIHFHPIGLSGGNAVMRFARPLREDEGSYRVPTGRDVAVDFSCTTISQFMQDRGWISGDLLKLDIEGFEYEVLDDAHRHRITFRQICVEFHHFLPGVSLKDTMRSIRTMRRAGYRLWHKDRCDYLFVRPENES